MGGPDGESDKGQGLDGADAALFQPYTDVWGFVEEGLRVTVEHPPRIPRSVVDTTFSRG